MISHFILQLDMRRTGTSRTHFVGLDIFTDMRYEQLFVSSETADMPIINRTEYQVHLCCSCCTTLTVAADQH